MLLVSEGALDSVAQFLTVLVLFVIVLGITYLTTRYIAGVQKGNYQGNNIRLLEAMRIAPNVHVQLLKIGERYFALAVGKDSVTLIAEFSEDEIPSEGDSEGEGKASCGPVFGKILDIAKKKVREK